MLQEYISSQPILYKALQSALKSDKLSHAYLFELYNYEMDMPFVMAFIKEILTQGLTDEEKQTIMRRIDDKNYAELKIVEPDGLVIKKEQLTELQREFSMKAIEGKYKIYIIKECDKLNASSANSILKFLEEPEANIIAILVTNNKNAVLPTIISRCQCYKMINHHHEKSYPQDDLLIMKAIQIVEHIERENKNILAYSKDLIPASKEEFMTILTIMINLYKESLYKRSNLFENYQKQLDEINFKNHLDNIAKLLNYQQLVLYNVNINLLFDKMIIEMKEVIK